MWRHMYYHREYKGDIISILDYKCINIPDKFTRL